MIIARDTHPERQLYYLGAKILEILSARSGASDFFEVYKHLKEQEDISVMLFILALDWLYLLGVVNSNKGLIKLCS